MELWARKLSGNFCLNSDFHLNLGIFYMPQIYDTGPTALLPLRRKACWGFLLPKNPTASAGVEPANLGTKGQHATSRPPKTTYIYIYIYIYICLFNTVKAFHVPIFIHRFVFLVLRIQISYRPLGWVACELRKLCTMEQTNGRLHNSDNKRFNIPCDYNESHFRRIIIRRNSREFSP